MLKKESKEVSRIEPSRPLSPFEEMERRFDEFFRRPFSLMAPSGLPGLRTGEVESIFPTVDIFEEGDDVVLKAELPGMKKEDLDVKLTDHTVIISGEKKKEIREEKKNFYRLERSYGSFTRSFRMPSEVDFDKARASLKDGVLEIRVPKSEQAKQKEKKIAIE